MKYSAKGEIIHTVELTGQDILEMFVSDCFDIPVPAPATSIMEIKFKVPGVGDYSSCSVEFKDEPRVIVTWKSRETSDADLDQG